MNNFAESANDLPLDAASSVVPPGTGSMHNDRATETEAHGLVYPNGAPTYTTEIQVPGEPPWAGTADHSLTAGLSAEAVEKVQHLIELNVESVKGWEAAAEAAVDAPLRVRFREIADQRRGFADELRGLIRRAGETRDAIGSVGGTVHNWWMNLRASIGGYDMFTVLEDAERSESAVKLGYEGSLKEGGLGSLARIIGDQAVHVRRVHDEVKRLRDRW